MCMKLHASKVDGVLKQSIRLYKKIISLKVIHIYVLVSKKLHANENFPMCIAYKC